MILGLATGVEITLELFDDCSDCDDGEKSDAEKFRSILMLSNFLSVGTTFPLIDRLLGSCKFFLGLG